MDLATTLFALTLMALMPARTLGMELKVVGNQLILSGGVVGDEPEKVREALANSPEIDTVVLCNSPGGDAPAGYQVGQMLRERGIRTGCQVIAILRARECFSAAELATSPTIISRRATMWAFTGIMIGAGISTPIACVNTVYAIGSSDTAMEKPTPRWWSAGSTFRTAVG
jgi:hypothetical protein